MRTVPISFSKKELIFDSSRTHHQTEPRAIKHQLMLFIVFNARNSLHYFHFRGELY